MLHMDVHRSKRKCIQNSSTRVGSMYVNDSITNTFCDICVSTARHGTAPLGYSGCPSLKKWNTFVSTSDKKKKRVHLSLYLENLYPLQMGSPLKAPNFKF